MDRLIPVFLFFTTITALNVVPDVIQDKLITFSYDLGIEVPFTPFTYDMIHFEPYSLKVSLKHEDLSETKVNLQDLNLYLSKTAILYFTDLKNRSLDEIGVSRSLCKSLALHSQKAIREIKIEWINKSPQKHVLEILDCHSYE